MMTDFSVDFARAGEIFAPLWRVCVGGGRVAEALRADFQRHLEMAQREMPFQYIRMHGLFHEDMMVYREEHGQPIYNWQYVDLVYDHWLSIGIRPFVELGFMPYDMASGSETVFWWKGNITPPTEWARWAALVRHFVEHCIERYGIAEVRRWYFEVWNEPNLPFFWKDADFDAYLTLYATTAKTIKEIDARLRVGGPATAGTADNVGKAPWGKKFLQACTQKGLPVDFFSTHPYPTLHPVDLEGHGYMVWGGEDRLTEDLVPMAEMLDASPYPRAERHYTEWSSSPSPRDRVHDTAFLAPFIIENNWRARGLCNSLSFWVVSDIFEENRQGDTPFHGGFGLVNVQGLKKPSYHGYWFLAQLGNEELASGDNYAVTRHPDGRLAILLWNYSHYRDEYNDSRAIDSLTAETLYQVFQQKTPESFTCTLNNIPDGQYRLQTTQFDREHGSVFDAWVKMGAPAHIRREDLAVLRQQMVPQVTAQRLHAANATLQLIATVEAHGVTLLELTQEAEATA